jgi:hypothetical protein
MSHHADALAWAEAQVAAVRNDPAQRLALLARTYHGPTGRAPRHLPFRRAALSFMRWQADRGVLNSLDASPPGSVWWRAVNAQLLRDGCESVALSGGLAGEPSSPAVRLWLHFIARHRLLRTSTRAPQTHRPAPPLFADRQRAAVECEAGAGRAVGQPDA